MAVSGTAATNVNSYIRCDQARDNRSREERYDAASDTIPLYRRHHQRQCSGEARQRKEHALTQPPHEAPA